MSIVTASVETVAFARPDNEVVPFRLKIFILPPSFVFKLLYPIRYLFNVLITICLK